MAIFLGQNQSDRVPFSRPVQATPGFQPRALSTGFPTHLRPFATMTPVYATYPRGISQPASAQPGGAPPAGAPVAATAQPTPPATAASPGRRAGGGLSPYAIMRSGMVRAIGRGGPRAGLRLDPTANRKPFA